MAPVRKLHTLKLSLFLCHVGLFHKQYAPCLCVFSQRQVFMNLCLLALFLITFVNNYEIYLKWFCNCMFLICLPFAIF